eukprot:97923-Amphidinium_carterae.1
MHPAHVPKPYSPKKQGPTNAFLSYLGDSQFGSNFDSLVKGTSGARVRVGGLKASSEHMMHFKTDLLLERSAECSSVLPRRFGPVGLAREC